MTETHSVNLDGAPPASGDQHIIEDSAMPLILEMLRNPETPVSDISRCIAQELGAVINAINNLNDATTGYRLKFLREQVKALRELSKTLYESETLTKRDILNFDGPKFLFVYQELMSYFRKALLESGISEDAANAILRQFRDIVTQKEPELRKQCEKVDSSYQKR